MNQTEEVYRVLIKTPVGDHPSGDTILLGNNNLEALKTNYPDSIVEIPMTEKEWVQYLTFEYIKSYEKVNKLQAICERMGLNLEPPEAIKYLGVSLRNRYRESYPFGGDLDIEGKYLHINAGTGLSDLTQKVILYKGYIDEFEKDIFSKINLSDNIIETPFKSVK